MHSQVILVLRWLRRRLDLPLLARDAGVSIASTYRYLHAGLDEIAGHAPDLADVRTRAHAAAWYSFARDGTLVPTDRVAAQAEVGHDLW